MRIILINKKQFKKHSLFLPREQYVDVTWSDWLVCPVVLPDIMLIMFHYLWLCGTVAFGARITSAAHSKYNQQQRYHIRIIN